MDSTIIGSIIGVSGMLLGVIISEVVRRRSRVEKFSEAYFIKKIEIYDELVSRFLDLELLFSDVTQDDEYMNNRYDDWQQEVIDFLSWCDKKFLYLGEELTVHIGIVLVGAGGYVGGSKEKEKKEILSDFRGTKLLMKEALGFNHIEKKVKVIANSKVESGYIDYYRKIKKEQELKNT